MTHPYESKQIAYTCIGGKVVSTIKLPEIYEVVKYETMMYDKDTGFFDDYQERYATEEEAIRGHIKTIQFYIMGDEG